MNAHVFFAVTAAVLLLAGNASMASSRRDFGRVEGLVTDRQTGAAVPGAVVFIDDAYAGATDANGAFTIDSVRPGRTRDVAVVAAGFDSYRRSFRIRSSELVELRAVLSKEPGATLDSELSGAAPASQAVLVGRVTDARTGRMVENVAVTIPGMSLECLTDKHGCFGLLVSAAGQHNVSLVHHDYRDSVVRVDLTGGAVSDLAVALVPARSPLDTAGCIQGWVLSEHRKEAVSGAQVVLLDDQRPTTTDHAGTFMFSPVTAGVHSLAVTAWGHSSRVVAGIQVSVDDTAHTEILLAPREIGADVDSMLCTVNGVVVGSGGEPVSDAVVCIDGTVNTSVTDRSGVFAIDSIRAGSHVLAVSSHGIDTIVAQIVDLEGGEERAIRLAVPSNAAMPSEDQAARRSGAIQGMIVHATEQKPLSGVTVQIPELNIATVTDLGGRYAMRGVRSGIREVIVDHQGFSRFADTVKIEAGGEARLDVALLPSGTTALARQVIRAAALQNTSASLLRERQLSLTVSDNISADEMSKTGVSNAADAMKYVPGVTLVDGKYPIIRGMGDRYISSLISGMPLPSPNPDKPAVTFDLFPTSLLDNISVYKTFTPDMWGNFSAGAIEINLKSFPEQFVASISASVGANDHTTFRDDFLTYDGGSTDWLGIDDGARKLPPELEGDTVWTPAYTAPLTAGSEDSALKVIERIDEVAKAFDNVPLEGEKTSARPNQSYGLYAGGTVPLFGRPLGLMASLAYSNSLTTYHDEEAGLWTLAVKDTVDSLDRLAHYSVTRSKEEVLWGGLVNAGYSLADGHDVTGSYMYTRSAEDEAKKAFSDSYYQIKERPDAHLEHNELKYVERGLHFGYLAGSHTLKTGLKPTIEWRGSVASGLQSEPDYRASTNLVEYLDGDTVYDIRRSLGTTPSHLYRRTEEKSGSLRLDCEMPFRQWSGYEGTIKVGAAWQSRKREFFQRRFRLEVHSPASRTIDSCDGDLNEFASNENMGLIAVDTVRIPGQGLAVRVGDSYYYIGNMYIWDAETDTTGSHSGAYNPQLSLERWAAYLMARLPLTKALELVGGFRYEPVEMRVQSRRRDDPKYSGSFRRDKWPLLLSLKYSLPVDMNLRMAYSKTYATPTFRELAPYQSYDPVLMEPRVGNPDLKPTDVDNIDARWEWFVGPGEVLALTGFYKYAYKPIVLAQIQGGANNEKQWMNADEGTVLGAEVELRKDLGFIHSSLNGLVLSGNLTVLRSDVGLDSIKQALLDSNISEPDLEPAFINASPYVVNAGIVYERPGVGMSAGVYFNVFGRRRVFQTSDITPDVYEFPRPELNVTVSKTFLKRVEVRFRAKNLLDASYVEGHSYRSDIYERTSYQKGRAYSLGMKLSLN